MLALVSNNYKAFRLPKKSTLRLSAYLTEAELNNKFTKYLFGFYMNMMTYLH